MTRKTDYTNAAQQRILQLVVVMFGDVVNGFTPGTLAQAMGCAASVITRDLANLATAGIAECDEATRLWRLTPRLPEQSYKVFAAVQAAKTNIALVEKNILRNT